MFKIGKNKQVVKGREMSSIISDIDTVKNLAYQVFALGRWLKVTRKYKLQQDLLLFHWSADDKKLAPGIQDLTYN